jgi:hypothetical protein
MVNEKIKNKNILKNVRGVYVTSALSRRPYPGVIGHSAIVSGHLLTLMLVGTYLHQPKSEMNTKHYAYFIQCPLC